MGQSPAGRFRPLRLTLALDTDAEEAAAVLARLRVVLAIDDSGSMHVDPAYVRGTAGVGLVRFMRRHGGGRCGIVHYSHRMTEALAPVDVRSRRRSLDAALGPRRPRAAATSRRRCGAAASCWPPEPPTTRPSSA